MESRSAEPTEILVNWDGPDDPECPQNMSRARKWLITLVFGSVTVWVTFSSSVFSPAVPVTAREYQVSTEVTTLGTSLTVLGLGIGPLVWGPMSEVYGRLTPLYVGYSIFAVLQIGIATTNSLTTLLILRFLIGFFGTSSLAVVGGALADFWDPVDRAIAISIYSAATFVGPIMGPILGGFIVDSYLGWRWIAWITLIASSAFGLLSWFIVPETYHPVLLQRRAALKRKLTGNMAYTSQLDQNAPTAKDILTKYIFRPIQMLILEPILVCITIYISLIYGILYLFFTAYPISFGEVRGWKSAGIAALPFTGILVGVLLGCIFVAYCTRKYFVKRLKASGGQVIPEDRLPPMMVAAILLPVGLFWYGWTSDPHIHWAAQAFAGVPIGMGILVIWMQGLNYLIDVYLMFANSAISGNTLIRSSIGAAFPLFAGIMYHRLGVAWATSLLGFLSLSMVPIPVVFYFYGARIRALSKFRPKL